MSQTLGQRIRQARKASGMTQDQLAQNIPVSRQTVSSWENDRTQPDYETLQKIAALLGIGVAELFQKEEPVQPLPGASQPPEEALEIFEETPPVRNRGWHLSTRQMSAATLAIVLVVLAVLTVWHILPKVDTPPLEWFMSEQTPAENAAFLKLSASQTPVVAYAYPQGTPPRWSFRVIMEETGGVPLNIQQITETFFSHEWFGKTVAARQHYVDPWVIQQHLGSQYMGAGEVRMLGLNLEGDSHTAGVGIAVDTLDENGNIQVFHIFIPFENP